MPRDLGLSCQAAAEVIKLDHAKALSNPALVSAPLQKSGS